MPCCDIGINPRTVVYGDVETRAAMEKPQGYPGSGWCRTATTAILMRNTVEAAKWQLGLSSPKTSECAN